MANAYATVDDLGAYLGKEPPADSQRMLARAQDLLDAALKSSPYAVDANGNPTDAAVIAAFNKAACAQVEYWIENGDEFAEIQKLRTASVEGIFWENAAGVVQRRLCDRAWDALAKARPASGIAVVPGKPSV